MADVKITALPAASGLTSDDLFPIVNDPAGTPATQKLTAAQLLAFVLADASLTEKVQDIVGAFTVAGANITLTYDDAANTLTIAVSGLTESVQDILGALASGGLGLTTTYDDTANTWVLDVSVDNSTIEIASDALRVKDAGITNAKLANVATATIKGRTTVGTGAPEDLTPAQARVVIALDKRTTFSNADYTALATDKYVAQVGTLSAARTVTLPAASAVNAGFELLIADESGSVTNANTITIARAGSDTINGAASYTIKTPYAVVRLVSDGASKWSYDVVGPGRGGALAEGRVVALGTTNLSIPGVELSATTTKPLNANNLRYQPILVFAPITIDQLIIEVTAAGAGGTTARLGIYNADASWVPGSLVVDAGTVAVDSTGVKTITLGTPQVLTPGRYFLVDITDGAPTLRAFRGGNRLAGLKSGLGGTPFIEELIASQAYGALPTPGTAVSTVGTGSSPFLYHVLCRISSAV